MMEVETAAQPAWDQFKEEVEIMEEGSDASAGELLTREIKKRLLDHGHENGNGDANGGGEEEAPEAEEQHRTISFDPAKVPDIITEVSARYLVTEAMRSGPEEEGINETPSPKGKELEAHEKGSAEETNHGPSNGKLENGSHSNGSHKVSNGTEPEIEYIFRIDKTEIFPAQVEKDEHVTEAQPKENGSHSNGSHQVTDGAEPEIPYMFQIDKTEIFPDEVAKDEHITEAQPQIEEYDLEKILDQQETHDLYCPNCKSCITRRVILRKRKRTARPATSDEPPKRPHTEEAPSLPVPERDEQGSPEVFRCLSCFSFFIPTGCSFNIFRIFGRRDQQVDVLPPPASEDMPRSENCTSWLLSCFQPGDSPNQAAADSLQTPLLLDTAASGDTTTTTTATSASYVHSHDTVVKPEQSSESSSQHQTTTITTTTTTTSATATTSSTTTSAAASTSSHTSSATGIFHTDVMEVITGEMPPPKPAGGAILGASHLLDQEDVQGPATPTVENGSFSSHSTHTSGFKVDSSNVTNIVPGFIPRDNIPTSPSPQTADPPHLAVSVSEDVSPAAPRPQQRDDWDILKAIVYGGLVESITSLSVVSAAASSGAKTLDIFILGIANLIGGLPLIFHNIADLRDIQDVDGNDEQVGHYWMQLGRRSKSQLHMVLALLSYIIFGLLSPVLYGLSFRESNDRENKIMTVAAASLACIVLLALGKAHVQSRHRTYFKTLMYYLMIAVSCSGLSYVAGVLITRLLVHFGVIDQGGASAGPAPPGLSSFPHAVGAETSAWASF